MSGTLAAPAPGAARAPGPAGAAVEPTLVDRVRTRLASSGGEPTPARVAAALRAEGRVLGDAAVLGVVGALRSEIAGAGLLEPLLRDPDVTDVLVNAPGEVWVDRGSGLERAAVGFPDDRAVRRLAQRLAAGAGRRLDDASPYVDARLPDGVRLHAVLPPASPRATCLSLRVFRRRGFTLEELIESDTVPPEGASWLRAIVAARLAFLVSGGTGTGKTTILSTLLGLADPRERLILVEDAGELRPDHPHIVRLETRPPNLERAGEITLRDLVRQSLRMRPDRIVVGEVRGAEVADLLAAFNTGHEGGCGTLHANTASDVPARLEALGLAAGLTRPALHSQLSAGVEAIVHLGRVRGGRRRVVELCVLERAGSDHGGPVVSVPAVTFTSAGDLLPGPGEPRLRALLECREVTP
ncbi:MAG: TadA family conjugal transfer-associated ATPase [Streptomycetales bacterium]